MKWPEFFPESCPPQDSSDATGGVYRLINGSTPGKRDFKSYREINPSKPYEVPECQVCSLSVYTDKAGIIQLKNRVPATRKKSVSYGELNASYGKIKHTPYKGDSHHSWWVTPESQPWLIFKRITMEI